MQLPIPTGSHNVNAQGRPQMALMALGTCPLPSGMSCPWPQSPHGAPTAPGPHPHDRHTLKNEWVSATLHELQNYSAISTSQKTKEATDGSLKWGRASDLPHSADRASGLFVLQTWDTDALDFCLPALPRLDGCFEWFSPPLLCIPSLFHKSTSSSDSYRWDVGQTMSGERNFLTTSSLNSTGFPA